MTQEDPLDMLKKAFLIGLGATALTVEKVQKLADELVERGDITKNDAKTFTEDLKERAKKEAMNFETQVKETVEDYMKSAAKTMGVVTREEYDTLKAELEQLKAQTAGSVSEL